MRFFFICLLGIGIAIAQTPTKSSSKQRPNIIVILADDFGYNQLSCYGNPHQKTPNLDFLANNGIRFTNGYVTPQCSPTRAALLSGKNEARSNITRVIHEKHTLVYAPMTPPEALLRMPEEWHNMAKMVKNAGYTTGLAGKWHVADNYSAAPLLKNKGTEYFKNYGFDWVSSIAENDAKPDKAVTALTDDAIRFIENSQNQPFFLYLSHFTTHSPMSAPKILTEKYIQQGFKKSTDIWGNYDEIPTADYLAMNEHFDNSVGILIAKLKSLQILENTLIVFLGDNGGLNRYWKHTPLREAKGTLYEGGVRVPFIFYSPNIIKTPQVVNQNVDVIDLYPTFMDLVNGSKPIDYETDGQSLMPIINGKMIEEKPIYRHHPHYTSMYGKTPCSSIIDGNYKLIWYQGDFVDTKGAKPVHQKFYGKLIKGEKIELYNLKNDISETKDLVNELPKIKNLLLKKLKNYLKEVNAQMPFTNPKYDPQKAEIDIKDRESKD